MNWLRDRINPKKSRYSFHSQMYVFDDHTEATVYADLLTTIEQSPDLELVDVEENWDQTGILTKIVTYKRRNTDG